MIMAFDIGYVNRVQAALHYMRGDCCGAFALHCTLQQELWKLIDQIEMLGVLLI
jgi:hypothetical protein